MFQTYTYGQKYLIYINISNGDISCSVIIIGDTGYCKWAFALMYIEQDGYGPDTHTQ